jgi:serine phosphatase RsbU (regulator of sigma subunit)
VPAAPATAPGWDLAQLERILAPWSDHRPGWSVVIADVAGRVVAGSAESDQKRTPQFQADILVGDDVVGRIVAHGPGRPDPSLGPALASLAIAIGDSLAARQDLDTAQLALDGLLATGTGTDPTELVRARRQQRSIVSLVAPDVPGYDLASHYEAAHEIGGDYFELFRLARRGHPLGIVIADVTGKSIDAALLMAFSRPVMHAALNAASGPSDALERTNRVLVGEHRATLFLTAVCAVLRPHSGRIRIANAGHEPPLLVPGDGGPIAPVGESGVLVGAFATLDAPEVEIVIRPGDTLLFYTDGATDAVDPSGQRFGDERLIRSIESAHGGTAHDLVAAVRDAVTTFRAGTAPADDLTLVAIGRQPRSSA